MNKNEFQEKLTKLILEHRINKNLRRRYEQDYPPLAKPHLERLDKELEPDKELMEKLENYYEGKLLDDLDKERLFKLIVAKYNSEEQYSYLKNHNYDEILLARYAITHDLEWQPEDNTIDELLRIIIPEDPSKKSAINQQKSQEDNEDQTSHNPNKRRP